MVYVDTSVIVKLYIREEDSRAVAVWLRENNEAVPLTSLHELEFMNAIGLKEFRSEISPDENRHIMSSFEEHEVRGVFYRPPIDWSSIFSHAGELSQKYTAKIGSRSLDILHVASALTINADQFLTFDDRQTRLAKLAGLQVGDLRSLTYI